MSAQPSPAPPVPLRLPPARWAVLWVACFCAGAWLAPGFNSFESPDPNVAQQMAIAGRLTFDAPPPDFPYYLGRGGRYYAHHELGPDLLAAPFALVALQVSRRSGIPFRRSFGFVMSLVAPAFFATTIVLLAALGALLGVPPYQATALLVVLCLGSQYAVYAGSPPDVSMASPLMAGCLLAWARAERGMRSGWLAAGVLAGLLPAFKLSNAPVIPVLLLLAATAQPSRPGDRWRRVAWTLVGLVPGLALVVAWNVARTGSAIDATYGHELFAYHPGSLLAGLAGSLVSPGKGLLAYTPVLVLLAPALGTKGTCRAHPRLAFFVLASLALAMLRLAGTPEWSGAGGWGIRYYVPWLPPLLLLVAAELWRLRGERGPWKAVAAATLAAGAVVNLSAAATGYHYREQLCGYEAWSLRGANACAVAALPANLARTAGRAVPEVVVPGASRADVFASNRLALWWYAIRFVGVRPAVSWAIGGALLLLGAACWRLARARPQEAAP